MEHIQSRINNLQRNIETLQPTDMHLGFEILEYLVILSVDMLTNNNATFQIYKP